MNGLPSFLDASGRRVRGYRLPDGTARIWAPGDYSDLGRLVAGASLRPAKGGGVGKGAAVVVLWLGKTFLTAFVLLVLVLCTGSRAAPVDETSAGREAPSST